MPENTIIEEAKAAVRGTVALLIGDRGAARYFNFDQSGLVASFIGLLAAMGLQAIVFSLVGSAGIFSAVAQSVLFYIATMGASALYLRQIGRWDALVPLMVAGNWSDAVLGVATLIVLVPGTSVLGYLSMIAAVVLMINIARLIMTLRPLQIVLLVIAQAVGLIAALLVLVMLFPPTAEQLAAIQAAAGS